MAAVKNSRKRRPAWSPAATTSTGSDGGTTRTSSLMRPPQGSRNVVREATPSCGRPEQRHTECAGRRAQGFVERRERQAAALGKLQVGGIVDREREPLGKAQRRAPSVGIGLGVDRDRQQGELGQRGIAKGGIDALRGGSLPEARW